MIKLFSVSKVMGAESNNLATRSACLSLKQGYLSLIRIRFICEVFKPRDFSFVEAHEQAHWASMF